MNWNIPTNILTRIDNIGFTVGAVIAGYFVSFFLRRLLSMSFRSVQTRKLIPEAYIGKTNTINSVLFNIFDVVIFGVTLLIVLSHWKVDISPILTGAGIFGLAITFGSQTLVKDLISGFFIISEGQFNVGDNVKIGTFTGRVSKVTLRLTVLRDEDGNRIYIPNSTIRTVIRMKLVKKSSIIRTPRKAQSKQKDTTTEAVLRAGFHA